MLWAVRVVLLLRMVMMIIMMLMMLQLRMNHDGADDAVGCEGGAAIEDGRGLPVMCRW